MILLTAKNHSFKYEKKLKKFKQLIVIKLLKYFFNDK